MGSDSHDLLPATPRTRATRLGKLSQPKVVRLSLHVRLSGHCQPCYHVLRITETLLPHLYALLFFVLYGIVICDEGVLQSTKESWPLYHQNNTSSSPSQIMGFDMAPGTFSEKTARIWDLGDGDD